MDWVLMVQLLNINFYYALVAWLIQGESPSLQVCFHATILK